MSNAKLKGKSSRDKAVLALAIFAVSAAVLITHWPALSAKAFCFDDNQYLVDNWLVKNPSWASAKIFLSEILAPSTVSGYYQPLAMISLMLDYARGGNENNLSVFHQTSLALHICNTALVMVLIFTLFGRVWAAVAAGLLFGLHPMTVETIAWVGERKTVLSAFFALLALNFYVRFANKGGWKFYILTFLAYVLALMSKPTTTPLPLLMLVLDYWPLRRFGMNAILEKLPLLAIGTISAIITLISQSATSGVNLPGQYPIREIPMVVSYCFLLYLSNIFYPVRLSSFYPFPASLDTGIWALIGMFLIIVLVILSLRRTRIFLAGMLFFFIGILPTMQLVGFSNSIASDKYAYLPAVGLLISGTALLIWLFDAVSKMRLKTFCTAGIAALILLAAALEAAETRQYLSVWKDTKTLVFHMVEMAPTSAAPHYTLGLFYYNTGEIDKARQEWFKTLELNPQYAPALNNLGALYYRNGHVDKAVSQWSKALEFNPNFADALNNLAWVLATDKDPKIRDGNKALQLARHACRLTFFKNGEKLDTLAAACAELGQFDQAVAAIQKAILLAQESGQKDLAGDMRKRLALYQNHQPFRQ